MSLLANVVISRGSLLTNISRSAFPARIARARIAMPLGRAPCCSRWRRRPAITSDRHDSRRSMSHDPRQRRNRRTRHRPQVVSRLTVGAAASLLPGCATKARTQSPRILKFSDHEPLGGMRTRFLKDVLFPAIENESDGRLVIESHWNGEIAASYDALGAVSKGTADMATVVPEYTAKELPLHQIFKGFPRGRQGAGRSTSSAASMPTFRRSRRNCSTTTSCRCFLGPAIRSRFSAPRR